MRFVDKLKVGGVYTTRYGTGKTTIISKDPGCSAYPFKGDDRRLYTETGEWLSGKESNLNLVFVVSEPVDPPAPLNVPSVLPDEPHFDVIGTTIAEVHFPGYTFKVVRPGWPVAPYLQAEFMAPCNHNPDGPLEVQRTRKWQLSPHMTKSEVVQTAFKCVLTSLEHEAREQFKYRDAAIFGPHFDVDDLVDLVQSGKEDTR